MENLESRIEAIYELQEMVYKNGLRIGELAKNQITQCTTYFRELNKRLEQIESNEEKERKKFEQKVKLGFNEKVIILKTCLGKNYKWRRMDVHAHVAAAGM